MPNSDPQDRFFCPHQTVMIDSYNLTHDILPMGRIKKVFSREFGVHWLYRTSSNIVIRLTSLRRRNDFKFQNVNIIIIYSNECYF